MDKYIIETRARMRLAWFKMRLAWFKRYEEIGNITQVCREFGVSRKPFNGGLSMLRKDSLVLETAQNALRTILRLLPGKLLISS